MRGRSLASFRPEAVAVGAFDHGFARRVSCRRPDGFDRASTATFAATSAGAGAGGHHAGRRARLSVRDLGGALHPLAGGDELRERSGGGVPPRAPPPRHRAAGGAPGPAESVRSGQRELLAVGCQPRRRPLLPLLGSGAGPLAGRVQDRVRGSRRWWAIRSSFSPSPRSSSPRALCSWSGPRGVFPASPWCWRSLPSASSGSPTPRSTIWRGRPSTSPRSSGERRS